MAANKVLAVAICLGIFARVITASLLAFMEKMFVVLSGTWRDTRTVEQVGIETKGSAIGPSRKREGP